MGNRFLVAGWVYGLMCLSDYLEVSGYRVEWGGFMMAGWVCCFFFVLAEWGWVVGWVGGFCGGWVVV